MDYLWLPILGNTLIGIAEYLFNIQRDTTLYFSNWHSIIAKFQ